MENHKTKTYRAPAAIYFLERYFYTVEGAAYKFLVNASGEYAITEEVTKPGRGTFLSHGRIELSNKTLELTYNGIHKGDRKKERRRCHLKMTEPNNDIKFPKLNSSKDFGHYCSLVYAYLWRQ